MAGIRPYLEDGPLTCFANVLIKGGQLVMPDSTTGRVKPATALAKTVLGVALGDASAYNFTNPDTTDAWGNPVTAGATYPPNEVAVAWRGAYRLVYSAACAYGVLLVAAANGLVQPYTAGTDTFDMIVGRCIEPAGVSAGDVAAGTRMKTLIGAVGSA